MYARCFFSQILIFAGSHRAKLLRVKILGKFFSEISLPSMVIQKKMVGQCHLKVYKWSKFYAILTHLWPFSKSKFNLKSDCVYLVAPASPIDGLRYLHNVQSIQYKLGPERLTWYRNSNVLRLPVFYTFCVYYYCW